MKLIVGLGNPGKEYEKTRHNIGFMAIDNYLGEVKYSKKFNGEYYETNINGEKYIFVRPLGFMNLSGKVVYDFMNFYKLNINDLLIIQDDMDLDFGKIRIKINSSSGGHNGIKNIEMHLGTKNYKRLKIGISNNKKIDTKDYVLGKLNSDDRKVLDEAIKTSVNIIDDYFNMNFDKLMNKYN